MQHKSIKILIADDHQLIISSIKSILINIDIVEKVFQADSKFKTIQLLSREFIDIIFLDVNMNGINMLDHIEEIRNITPSIKIIILTSYSSQSILNEAISHKVDAFLLKNTDESEIRLAMNKIMSGELYITGSPDLSSTIKDSFQLAKSVTDRELELIKLLAKGYTNGKIAESLFLSIHTVQTHRKNIHKKLGVKTVNELIAFAYENKLV